MVTFETDDNYSIQFEMTIRTAQDSTLLVVVVCNGWVTSSDSLIDRVINVCIVID